MTDTTFQGHLAVHGTGTTHGDQVELLAFYAHKSEYGLIVHTKKGASDVMRKFEESVQSRSGERPSLRRGHDGAQCGNVPIAAARSTTT